MKSCKRDRSFLGAARARRLSSHPCPAIPRLARLAGKGLGGFYASHPAFVEPFLRESRVTGSLSHPNIVTVHEYFEHEGTPFISMEYIERGSLRPLVGRLTLAQITGVMEGLLAGLAHAEVRGIVHRDPQPRNVMVPGG